MKHLKLFETTAAYNTTTLDLPNVSLIKENMSVYYNAWIETRVVVKYNVTNTSSSTTLRTSYEQDVFKSMEIDGVMLDELITEYMFDTVGIHTVKYELYDETKLGSSAPVFNNGNLVEIIIPNSVTSIGDFAFWGCSSLTNITIPNSVTSIGQSAFYSCSSLTSITIGSSVTYIGYSAFGSTDALKVLNYNAKCELSSSFRGSWHNLETVIIGDSTPSIGSRAFENCKRLISVIIGNSVASIEEGAFYNCSSLTSVTIGNNVTSIGNGAFEYCSSLTNITIPDSVTSIGNAAFYSCSNLTSITSNATTAPTIQSNTFYVVKTGGTLTVPSGSTGYDVWISTDDYYLGLYGWTKIEQ